MNRRVAFPFLTLSDTAVECSPWEISLDGIEWSEAGEFLSDWDASCDIRVRRTIGLLPEIAAEELGLAGDELAVAASVRIGTGQGRLPRQILDTFRRVLTPHDPVWHFDHAIHGRELSIILDLRTDILLAETPRRASPLSPRHPCDRVWSRSHRIKLEGEEPRFPVETVDLVQMLGDGGIGLSPWHLHWSPRDWGCDFHGAVRLYLNAAAQDIVTRIENEDSATIQLLLGDVMTQICERYLADPDADDLMESAEPGTLGAQVSTWLGRAWPGKDASFIRSVLENRPGVFRSTLLALAQQGVQE